MNFVTYGEVSVGYVDGSGWKSGPGRFTWLDQAVYEGLWVKNQRQGKGKLTQLDGTFYEGDWHEDKPHGEGTLQLGNNGEYKGSWRNG